MGKRIWLIVLVVVIVLGGGGYFLISGNEITRDDASPLINDALDDMDADVRADFDAQTAEMADVVIDMDDEMGSAAELLAMGEFMARAHGVEGKALLIDDGGKKIVRFENFETGNGPNLHIYLSSGLGDDDFIDLGKIKATHGNVNYEIPDGVDTDKYDKVLVWCVPFGVLFSYAELE